MLTDADTFQIAHNCELLFHHWGDECVVYNLTSGDTHLIDSYAALVLQRIAESASRLADLKLLLQKQLKDSELDLEAYLSTTLKGFMTIDLLAKIEGDSIC